MKAIHITGKGGPEVLSIAEVPDPDLGPQDVLVRVRASALNRADLLQCMGAYPAPPGAPPDIPGLEYAGEIERVGSRVTERKPGERVMGIVAGGAFAERIVVHEREAVLLPTKLDWVSAAAIPEAFFTAFDALVLQGALRPGETVLVHAIGSGVGTAALQIAQAFGATVVGTTRSPEKLERCQQQLGLAHGILVGEPPSFAQAVRKIAARGADVVLDLVGGTYLPETLASCARQARVMLVGLLAGRSSEVDLGALLNKRITLRGTVLRSRALEEKIAVAQAFERHLSALFEAGKLRPVVDDVVPMTEVRRACQRVLDNASFGKVVLRW